MPNRDRDFWLILLSFFTIYVVWGSTYLANAWGVGSIPPFLLAGMRFSIAGWILLLLSRLTGPIQFTKQQLINSAIVGFMLFTIGNGLAVWALKYIDSGLSALFVSLQPLIVALMLWGWKQQQPKKATWAGIALGISGMALLVGQPAFIGSTMAMLGVLAIFTALLAWSIIAIWMPDADLPESTMTRTALQMITGSVFLLIISPLIGELNGFSFQNVEPRAYWSLLYLIIFGSLCAMSAFNYLLRKVSPTKVVTNTYVNPVIALFLGWLLNNEEVTVQSILAGALLLGGVFFIIRAKRKTVQ